LRINLILLFNNECFNEIKFENMEVKFDLVRIGNIRKEKKTEIIIKQNLDILKNEIRSLFLDDKIENKSNQFSVVLVIPSKGHNIKIVLEEIKDENIKNQLRKEFPKSTYKGDYLKLLDNIDNKVFGSY
jgi:hypothetical protein